MQRWEFLAHSLCNSMVERGIWTDSWGIGIAGTVPGLGADWNESQAIAVLLVESCRAPRVVPVGSLVACR